MAQSPDTNDRQSIRSVVLKIVPQDHRIAGNVRVMPVNRLR